MANVSDFEFDYDSIMKQIYSPITYPIISIQYKRQINNRNNDPTYP